MIYEDERGTITDVAEGEFKVIQMIFSRKNSVRSNHYHLKGGHLLYVVSGLMLYRERPVESGYITEKTVHPGESIFTGPMIVHETRFYEDTVLVCAATVSRAGSAYDEDLVRENVGCQEA